MGSMTRRRIDEALRASDAAVRATFFDELPASTFKSAGRSLFVSASSTAAVVAMYSLVQDYCNGASPAVGAPLADALCALAVERYDQDPSSGIIPTTISGIADCHVKALNLLGRSQEALDAVARYVPLCERIGEHVNLPQLKVRAVEALVNLQRIDDAERALDDGSLFADPIASIEARRLRGIIDQLKRGVTDLPGAQGGAQPTSSEDLLGILRAAIGVGYDGPDKQALLDRVASMSPGARLDPNSPADFERLGNLLRTGEAQLTRGHGDSETAIAGRIRSASAIFVHGQPGPERIHASLEELRQCLAWARAHGVSQLVNDALWGTYLCHSRLGEPSEAADALIELREQLERARAHIADPYQRGGVFGGYRYLFHASCEQLHRAGRAHDLLVAIEAAKGRAIADKLTEAAGAAVDDAQIYGAVHGLPRLAAAHAFHYLTFFADEARLYVAMVTKHGEVIAPPAIELDSETLARNAANVDPRRWGAPLAWNPGEVVADASAQLAPLAAWLGDLVDRRICEQDDHLCYSPDGDMHNVPLHFLPLRVGRVIDWFSVSRVHSAHHLSHVLSRAPSPPREATAFIVPARDDSEGMARDFEAPARWLQQHCRGAVVRRGEATLERLAREPLEHRVVHFSTHGWFPNDRGESPYDGSYLLLAGGDGPPDKNAAAAGARDGRLTPRWLMEQQLHLEGSHVSLMACISGLAREGLGGDALGLDWALIQRGASSILSSHWNVSAAHAATFVTEFYTNWLSRGLSRATAHRRTVRELLADPTTPVALHAGAAFSLTGDFR